MTLGVTACVLASAARVAAPVRCGAKSKSHGKGTSFMPYRRTVLLAGMIALSAVATRPALARMYYVTYTGMASGVDTYGVFGAAGATLSNAAFTSIYTYDPTQFGTAINRSNGVQESITGGSEFGFGYTDPILSASVTINGQTYSQASSYFGREAIGGGYMESDAFSSPSNALVDYGEPVGTPTPSLTAVQSFGIFNSTGRFYYNGEYITLTDTQVAVTNGPSLSDVPEPTSLALLAGAAAVFAAARGCRRRASSRHKGIRGAAVQPTFAASCECPNIACTHLRRS